jgi:hypothetical protein
MNTPTKLGLTTALLLMAGTLTSYSSPAAAQISPLPLQMRNLGNQYCLAPTVTSPVLAVNTVACGSNLQRWMHIPVASGSSVYQLKSATNGRCLALGAPINGTNQNNVILEVCDAARLRQRWQRIDLPDSTLAAQYRSVVNGQHLSSNPRTTGTASAPVFTAPPQATSLQSWLSY